MSTRKQYSFPGEGRVWIDCVVVDDVEQHTKFQERLSTSHGCKTAGSKQCLVAGVPGPIINSQSKFLRVFNGFDTFAYVRIPNCTSIFHV